MVHQLVRHFLRGYLEEKLDRISSLSCLFTSSTMGGLLSQLGKPSMGLVSLKTNTLYPNLSRHMHEKIIKSRLL
jgi:hypothetical protein